MFHVKDSLCPSIVISLDIIIPLAGFNLSVFLHDCRRRRFLCAFKLMFLLRLIRSQSSAGIIITRASGYTILHRIDKQANTYFNLKVHFFKRITTFISSTLASSMGPPTFIYNKIIFETNWPGGRVVSAANWQAWRLEFDSSRSQIFLGRNRDFRTIHCMSF